MNNETVIETLNSLSRAAMALMSDSNQLKKLYTNPNSGSEETKQRLEDSIDHDYTTITEAYNLIKNA